MKTFQVLALTLIAAIGSAQQPISLHQAISLARAQRPTLEAARLRLTEANFTRRALGAMPTTRLYVGYTTDPEVGGSDDDWVLAQPIDLFGRTAASRASGDALVAQAEAALRQVSVEVQSEVVTAYIEAAGSAEMVRWAHSVQETLERLHEATRLRVEGGVAAGVQLIQVGLELEQAKLRMEQRLAELQANQRRLAPLIGASDPPAITNLPELEFHLSDEAAVVRQRPDLLLLAAEVRAAEADVRVARASSQPEFEIQGRRSPWQQGDARYGIRLQLSISLFDHGRSRLETRAATSRAEAARRKLVDATQLAVGEVAATRLEVDSAREQVAKYEALVATARDLVERRRPGFTEQATTLLEVLDATRTLSDIEGLLAEARLRLAQAQARYLRATGHLLEVTA